MSNRVIQAVPSKPDIVYFRRQIMSWFEKNGRTFEWRQTTDPFRLLIAELMLRRTQAYQVEFVYKELFDRYPDVHSLACGDPEELENILYHLGLYWRIPAFQNIAREIENTHKGKVPVTRKELKALPGVGEYVSGAVLSIAFNQKAWIVDSNIVRIFKRYFGVDISKEGRRDRHIIEMAKIYASTKSPRKANLAIIDFAALVCTSRNPHHEECPLKVKCSFYRRLGSKSFKIE